MDLGLPGISGKEAAQRIRHCDGGAEVKIVALTASAFSTERDAVIAAGLDGFLRKPYRIDEIFDYMAQQLDVQYAYAEDLVSSSLSESPAFLVMDGVPQELRDDLQQAVVTLEADRIRAAIARIAAHDPMLGRALASRADKLAYTEILRALGSAVDTSTMSDTP
jgi:CheY-like chemotaxis protein